MTDFDSSVYPDIDPPTTLETVEQKADYLHRICAAFDFGVVPQAQTLAQLASWKDIFDRFPLTGSPGYHALRCLFGLPPVTHTPWLGEPTYLKLDAIEERDDSCIDLV